jgi:chromosomal replication initiation ATPase DnaA
VTIYLIRKLRGETLITIGSEFKLNRHSSVSSVIERTGKRLQKDRKFKKRIEKINKILIKGQE